MEANINSVNCLDCDQPIEVADDQEVGDVLVCKNCGVELEVVSIDPIEVDYLLVEK